MRCLPGERRSYRPDQNLTAVPALIAFLLILCILGGPVLAAAPLTVTVSANPASVSPGGSVPITVLATYERVVITADTGGTVTTPLPDATVTLSSPASGITFTPQSGTTDSGGRFTSTLTTASHAAGDIIVYASVQDSRYSGNGEVIIALQGSSAPQPVLQPVPPAPGLAPEAVILVDRNAGYAPLAVQFDGRQSSDPDGTINDYRWSYGDGSTGTGYVSSHVFQDPGSYMATLIVTDNDGLSSSPASVGITVPGPDLLSGSPQPVAIIEVNQSFGPAPLVVQFDGSQSTGGGGTSTDLQWDFGDGTRSFDPVVTHVFPGPGAYDVMLTVRGNGGVPDAFSTMRILAQSSVPVPAGTMIPKATRPDAPNGLAGSPVDPRPGEKNPQNPASSLPFLRPAIDALTPLAGVMTGILLGAAAAVTGRPRPGNPGERKFYEFVKVVSGRKGVGALALWEKSRTRSIVNHRSEVLFGLSVAEILVALVSAVLVGSAFYLMYPDPGNIVTVLLLFSSVAGVSVVIHDLARRWVSRHYGRYTEYQLWPLGTIAMLLTAWLFTCPCGKPSRPVSEETAQDTRQRAYECLAGPGASVALACVSAGMVVWGGPAEKTLGTIGVSINLLLALYALMPFEPMEGRKIWAWNRPAYVLIIVSLLASYLAAAFVFSR